MSIARRAVKESIEVADLAVKAAKNELIEQLTPSIRAIVDAKLRSGTLSEDVDRLRRAADGHGETEFEEGKNMEDDEKFESISGMFPAVNEVADEDLDESMDDLDESTHDEVEESLDPVAEEKEDMDEDLEISTEELEEMYAESLQLEVDVSKGFRDMEKPHEFGAGAKGQYQSDPANLADYQNGEREWDNVDPPAKQDFTVKEQKIRAFVRKGLAENKALASQNRKLKESCKKLIGKLSEMNLLNSKILHVNRFLQGHRLTTEQKKTVIESIDRAQSIKEVKSIYSIVESTLKAAGAVNESARQKPRADAQKRRTSGAPDTQVLRESAARSENGSGFGRLQQLAGLKKLTNG